MFNGKIKMMLSYWLKNIEFFYLKLNGRNISKDFCIGNSIYLLKCQWLIAYYYLESSVIPEIVELQSGFQEREWNFIYCNTVLTVIYVTMYTSLTLITKMSGKHTLHNFFM